MRTCTNKLVSKANKERVHLLRIKDPTPEITERIKNLMENLQRHKDFSAPHQSFQLPPQHSDSSSGVAQMPQGTGMSHHITTGLFTSPTSPLAGRQTCPNRKSWVHILDFHVLPAYECMGAYPWLSYVTSMGQFHPHFWWTRNEFQYRHQKSQVKLGESR